MKFTFADYKSVLDYADYGKKYRKVMKFMFADSKSVYWVNSVVTFLNRLQFNNGSSPPQFQLALTLFTRTLVPRSYDSKSVLAGRVKIENTTKIGGQKGTLSMRIPLGKTYCMKKI
jgi:hypothetical protein